jgi:hypothetical protein
MTNLKKKKELPPWARTILLIHESKRKSEPNVQNAQKSVKTMNTLQSSWVGLSQKALRGKLLVLITYVQTSKALMHQRS